jgi:hypothetical protein
MYRKVPGFQVRGGGALKKLHRAEGGANIFKVFRVKNHDFTQKKIIFIPILGGGGALPCIRPWGQYKTPHGSNQGQLNSIIEPRAKQCTGAPTYTTTHRNKNFNGL